MTPAPRANARGLRRARGPRGPGAGRSIRGEGDRGPGRCRGTAMNFGRGRQVESASQARVSHGVPESRLSLTQSDRTESVSRLGLTRDRRTRFQ